VSDEMKARWLELSAAAMDELIAWREAHPRATFAQIEQELDERLATARARMLGELAQATPLAKAAVTKCPECGARLESSGKRRRSVRTRNEREVALEREYARCRACSAGLFPPR
jgi:uncharacterized protein with PIN domain